MGGGEYELERHNTECQDVSLAYRLLGISCRGRAGASSIRERERNCEDASSGHCPVFEIRSCGNSVELSAINLSFGRCNLKGQV